MIKLTAGRYHRGAVDFLLKGIIACHLSGSGSFGKGHSDVVLVGLHFGTEFEKMDW